MGRFSNSIELRFGSFAGGMVALFVVHARDGLRNLIKQVTQASRSLISILMAGSASEKTELKSKFGLSSPKTVPGLAEGPAGDDRKERLTAAVPAATTRQSARARPEEAAHRKTRMAWWVMVLAMPMLASCQSGFNVPAPWTRQLGTGTNDYGFSVATDVNGNVYVAGETYGNLDGNISAGVEDLYVVKYNSSGVKQWTRQLGTTGDDAATGVVTDASGNVYVVGYTDGNLDGNTSAGGYDLFVVKYDSNGVKQWTQQLGTAVDDYASGVAIDPSGNVYVSGYTTGGLDGNTSAGLADLFVVQYNSSGMKQWTQQLGTAANDAAFAVATDTNSNVYVVGETNGGLDGNANAGGYDLFVVKYDINGVKQWTQQLGTTGDDHAFGVATDTNNNVYVTGHTAGNLDGNTSAGLDDLFVVKYDTNGVKQWTQQLGSAADDYASGVAVDTSGNVYVSGYTDGNLDGNTSAGGYDLFVVKYNSSGVKQWTRQHGTVADDFASAVAVDVSGYVYLSGETYGNLDGNTNAGGLDLFVVKYAANGTQL